MGALECLHAPACVDGLRLHLLSRLHDRGILLPVSGTHTAAGPCIVPASQSLVPDNPGRIGTIDIVSSNAGKLESHVEQCRLAESPEHRHGGCVAGMGTKWGDLANPGIPRRSTIAVLYYAAYYGCGSYCRNCPASQRAY